MPRYTKARSKMSRKSLVWLLVIPTALGAQPRQEPPPIDDATAYCRFVTRKKLDNPPRLVFGDPVPVKTDRNGHMTVRVGYRVGNGASQVSVCKVRPLPNGDFQEVR